MRREVGSGAGRDDGRCHELDREGAERLLELELDTVVVERAHRLEHLKAPLKGDEIGIEGMRVGRRRPSP
jgi:hypothetical protein